MIEYEDTFPFDGALSFLKSTEAYSRENVRQIIAQAHALEMEVIPLVQTFGHLEVDSFILSMIQLDNMYLNFIVCFEAH